MSSRKQKDPFKEHPLLTELGIRIIKKYTTPRTYIGMGRFASYKDYGESTWRIGYGTKLIGERPVAHNEKLSEKEVNSLFIEDLKRFSDEVSNYVFVPLNKNRKAALLSFAHSVGLVGFKNSRLLELINSHASKEKIIREWSPYINTYWLSGGDRMRDRRRVELNTFVSGDKQIPTFTRHKCATAVCLLNLAETYNGSPTQIKAVEYLERKIKEWDPTGRSIRRFYQMWRQHPTGLGSPERPEKNALEDL